MTYTELAGAGVALAVAVDVWLLRTRLLQRSAFWISYVIMLGFQLLVNGVLTGVPVVRYNPNTIVGLRVGHAPVEDLAFGFTLILVTLSCWSRLSSRPRVERPDRETGEDPPT